MLGAVVQTKEHTVLMVAAEKITGDIEKHRKFCMK